MWCLKPRAGLLNHLLLVLDTFLVLLDEFLRQPDLFQVRLAQPIANGGVKMQVQGIVEPLLTEFLDLHFFFHLFFSSFVYVQVVQGAKRASFTPLHPVQR